MQAQQTKPPEAWIKVLAKGIVTIPKEFREKLGLKEGEVAKARVVGNKLIIESREAVGYRLFTDDEIQEMAKLDELSQDLAKKTKKYWEEHS